MKYLKRMKNESGFSLVELMTAVGIIGVMSSVAVPKYQKFRANAAQSEAQSALSSIYTLQQLHFTENDVYAVISLNYSSATSTDFTGLGTADELKYSPSSNSRYRYGGSRFKTDGTTAGTVSDAVRFKATANAMTPLASCSVSGRVDKWCINENKELQNTQTYSAAVHLPCVDGDSVDGSCG